MLGVHVLGHLRHHAPYADEQHLAFHGTAAASADGTRIYAGSIGISPPGAIVIYAPQSNTMATSLDDSQVIISGDRHLLVVPVN
jgi:hypothetical protein